MKLIYALSALILATSARESALQKLIQLDNASTTTDNSSMDSNTESLIKNATIADTRKEMKIPENNRKKIKAEVTVLSKKIDVLNAKLNKG